MQKLLGAWKHVPAVSCAQPLHCPALPQNDVPVGQSVGSPPLGVKHAPAESPSSTLQVPSDPNLQPVHCGVSSAVGDEDVGAADGGEVDSTGPPATSAHLSSDV